MSFDNRVFDVNGETKEELRLAFRLAFAQSGENTTAKYWSSDSKNGLLFHWYADEYDKNKRGVQAFPVPLDAIGAADVAWQWLKNSDDADKVELSSWFRDSDHDGSNSLGWRAYVGNWGHVGEYRNSLLAITPAYLWHGK